MGRLISVLFLMSALLLPVQSACDVHAQPVFFSMLFEQLIPKTLLGGQAEEAVLL